MWGWCWGVRGRCLEGIGKSKDEVGIVFGVCADEVGVVFGQCFSVCWWSLDSVGVCGDEVGVVLGQWRSACG